MNGRQILARACQGVLLLMLFTGALGCLAIAYLPDVRVRLVNFLIQDFGQFGDIGAALLCVGALLRLGCGAAWRGNWLRVRMGKHLREVDSELIRKTLEERLTRSVSRVFISGDRLEIQLGFLPDLERQLSQIEMELIPFLRDRFGYAGPFILTVVRN